MARGINTSLVHLDDDTYAIAMSDWVDDPEADAMLTTWGFDDSRRCIEMNAHSIARNRLKYVGRVTCAQCQQAGGAVEWVLARRLT